jgi:hypothetical protein
VSTNLSWNLTVDPSRGVRGMARFGQAMDHTRDKTTGFDKIGRKAFAAFGGAAVAGLAVGGAALGKFVLDGVKSAASYQKVLAKTAAVLKSTGNAAGTSVEGIKQHAAALESLSGVDEELIINSQNVLATFTNIRNVGKTKIFDMATESALDMSVALGSDLQGASIQVGKALNDPIKGVSALSKVGVTFTQTQKDVIKKLVDTGKTAEAQKVILAELNKEFGGAAKAAGAGFEGSMARVQDAISDTGREIGIMLLPKLSEAAEWMAKKIPVAVDQFKAGWKGVGVGKTEIASLAASLHNLSDSLSGITKQTKGSSNGFISFAKGGIRALTNISDGFAMLGANWKLVTTRIEQWNMKITLSWAKTVNAIARVGAKLPGPIGRYFRKIAADGQREINKLQAKMNSANTRNAQAQVSALDIKIRHLKGKTVKTQADKAALARSIQQVRTLISKNAALRSKSITISTRFVTTGRRTAPSEFMAEGGRAKAGNSYVVGDGGREELFVPDVDGTILPRVPPQSSPRPYGQSSAGVTIHVHVQGSVLSTQRELRDAVKAAMKAAPAGTGRVA